MDRFDLWTHREGAGPCFCLDCRSNRWVVWLILGVMPATLVCTSFVGALFGAVVIVAVLDTLSVWEVEEDE